MDEYSHTIEFLSFSMNTIWLCLLLVVLLFISALISGSETAFFSLSPSQLNMLRNDNSKQSHTAVQLIEKQDQLLSTILISNNLVNIGAIIVANSILESLIVFHEFVALEFVVKVVLVTFALLLFGEIMPKIFAAYNSYAFARLLAMPLKALRTLFYPMSLLLISSSSMISNALAHKRTNVSIDQLENAIDITKTESAEDKKMLRGIVRFVNTDVSEIMKPRIDVVALDEQADFMQVKQLVIDSGFSRIPVYRESFDHVQGVLYIKDLLPHLDKQADFQWQKLLRRPYFVPEHKKINDLLEDFQSRKIHLSIVVDEYGGTLGIVSLEDVLEEIVGDITDESDIEERFYTQIDAENYLFEGKIHLVEFLRILSLPEDFVDGVKGDADTLAGLMLEIRGEFFKPGDSVNYDNICFTAQEIDHYRITKVHVNIESADDAINS